MIDREERATFATEIQRRRGGGRPRIVATQRSVSLTVRVPEDLYDRIVRIASERRSDVAPLVRTLLDEFCTQK